MSSESITLKALPTDNAHYVDKSGSLKIKGEIPEDFASHQIQNVLMDLWEFGCNNFNGCNDLEKVFFVFAFQDLFLQFSQDELGNFRVQIHGNNIENFYFYFVAGSAKVLDQIFD